MSAALTDFVTNSVRTLMAFRNVAPEIEERIIGDVPIQISQAIIALQRKNFLPVKTLEKIFLDVKEEMYYPNGDRRYVYIKLPGDFSEFERMYVTPQVKEYQYYSDEYALSNKRPGEYGFTIQSAEHFESELGTEKRIILDPAPDDSSFITIKYHVNGVNYDFDTLPAQYWEAVNERVLIQLGLRAAGESSAIGETVYKMQHPKGAGPHNGTILKTKPSFFGKRMR